LRSEQGSRKASIERSGEQILEGQRTEALAQATVEACTAAIEQTRAALTSTAQAIEIAHRNAEAVRIKKIAELGEEIRKAKVRLDVIRGTMVDAREDLEGLGVAEQRVLESQAKLTEGGHTIKMAMAEVNKRRTTHQKRQNAVSKVIEERSKGLGAVAPGIAGAQLTIRALESNLAQRVKRVERTLGRLIQLDSMIDMAQSQEDAAVEAVADIQSWVDRSRLALQRCLTERNEQPAALSSPPVLPKAKDVETQTQVDKLLSRTKKRTTQGMSEIIPDPGAALDVDEAATMQFIAPANVSQADSDAATAIFERTGSEPLDSEVDEADAATLIFSREELRAKIEEAEEDARTSMMSREEMQATRNRKNQED
jgi:chromosome segregation ATPase